MNPALRLSSVQQVVVGARQLLPHTVGQQAVRPLEAAARLALVAGRSATGAGGCSQRAVVVERRLGNPRDWEAQVFPTIPAAEVGKKKPFGFWMKYQASTRFQRGELLQGLVALHEADVAMKSGQDGRLALERALLALLAGTTERSAP